MDFIIFLFIMYAIFGGDDKKAQTAKKKKMSYYKKNDSWLDGAWFHDNHKRM